MAEETVKSESNDHAWTFRRIGGLDLVVLESADDIRAIPELDQKLWTALACPVKGLEFDEKTLAMVDADNDGRVRAPEIVEAVKWLCASIMDPAKIIEERDALPLVEIKDSALERSARRILISLGKTDAGEISIADAADTAAIFSRTVFNGDGIIIPESAGEDGVAASIIRDVIATQGGVPDRSGKVGVDRARIEAFAADLKAFSDWCTERDGSPETVLPLGEDTGAALSALDAVRAKVNDFFARCRLAAFDGRALGALNRQESEFLAFAAKDLTISQEEIRGFPLARIEPSKSLPLDESVNPAWVGEIQKLRDHAAALVFGAETTTLSEAQWSALTAKLEPFRAWQERKAGQSVEKLGIDRVREILEFGPRDRLFPLLEEEAAVAPEFDAILAVEKLARFNRDLYRLLRNFVNFADFYAPDQMAIFQAGTLYLDSRTCDLVVRVENPAKHAVLAGLAKAYLAYLECTRPATKEKMTIAAAFMNGDSDRLMVGRNGIFYDREGRDWDATIIKVIENPISLREAFWAPYKRFVRMLEERVAKRAAAADAHSQKMMASAADKTANVDKVDVPEEPKRLGIGTVAAIAVAVSGIVAVLTVIVGAMVGMIWWQYPLAVLSILFLISGPSILIAAIKLHQRNLGPILDAGGWAVNGRVKINIPFGSTLTRLPMLPRNAKRTLSDPYGKATSPLVWVFVVLGVLGIGAIVGVLWDRQERGRFFWEKVVAPALTTELTVAAVSLLP